MESNIQLPAQRAYSTTSSRLVVPMMISFGLAGIIAAYAFIPSSNGIFRTWLSSLLALGVIWSYVLQRYGGRLPLRTDVLVMIGFSATHLLSPLYLSVRIYSEPSVDPYHVADMHPLVALVTTIGALALLIGYEVIERRFRSVVREQVPGRTLSEAQALPTILLLLSGVVWAARGILLVSGAYYWVYVNAAFVFGRWYSVTNQISGYGLIVPILLWLLAYRNSRWRRWAWLATAAELAWVIPSGSSLDILETLFGLLLVPWWCNQRLPRTRVTALLVVAVVAMPIIREYRYTISRFTDVNRIGLGATVMATQAAQDRFERFSGGTLLARVDSFAERLYDGQHLGYLLKHYREVYNWEYGKTYYTRVPFLLLPYFIFPDRPITQVPIDHWFKLVAGGSSPSTFLGEAYINFGYVGVPIIAFLMGMILAAYDGAFRRRQNDIFAVAVYLYFGICMLTMVSTSLASRLGDLRNGMLLMIGFDLVRRVLAGRTLGNATVFSKPRQAD